MTNLDTSWGDEFPDAEADIPQIAASPNPAVVSGATAAWEGRALAIAQAEGVAAGSALPTMPEPTLASSVSPKRRARTSQTVPGMRLTARDVSLLSFLGRFKLASVAQIARHLESSESALRNRMPKLERAGLVSFGWGSAGRSKLWLPTEAGLTVASMDLSVPKLSLHGLKHDLALCDLAIAMMAGGEICLSEREIRAASYRKDRAVNELNADVVAKPPTSPRMGSALAQAELVGAAGQPASQVARAQFTVPLVDKQGRNSGNHIPDLVLLRAPYDPGNGHGLLSSNVALELELTRKPVSSWQQILSAYVASNNFAQIYYFVVTKAMKSSLESVIATVPGAGTKIRVELFVPTETAADPMVS